MRRGKRRLAKGWIRHAMDPSREYVTLCGRPWSRTMHWGGRLANPGVGQDTVERFMSDERSCGTCRCRYEAAALANRLLGRAR